VWTLILAILDSERRERSNIDFTMMYVFFFVFHKYFPILGIYILKMLRFSTEEIRNIFLDRKVNLVGSLVMSKFTIPSSFRKRQYEKKLRSNRYFF